MSEKLIAVDGSTEIFKKPMPNPTPETLESPLFEAIWQVIKSWDVNVPDHYNGYMGASGSHVQMILDALPKLIPESRIQELETRVEVMERETKQIADESGCMRHSERHCGMTEAFGMVREEIRKLLET